MKTCLKVYHASKGMEDEFVVLKFEFEAGWMMLVSNNRLLPRQPVNTQLVPIAIQVNSQCFATGWEGSITITFMINLPSGVAYNILH